MRGTTKFLMCGLFSTHPCALAFCTTSVTRMRTARAEIAKRPIPCAVCCHLFGLALLIPAMLFVADGVPGAWSFAARLGVVGCALSFVAGIAQGSVCRRSRAAVAGVLVANLIAMLMLAAHARLLFDASSYYSSRSADMACVLYPDQVTERARCSLLFLLCPLPPLTPPSHPGVVLYLMRCGDACFSLRPA